MNRLTGLIGITRCPSHAAKTTKGSFSPSIIGMSFPHPPYYIYLSVAVFSLRDRYDMDYSGPLYPLTNLVRTMRSALQDPK
jgi:hypothetical protein